LARLRAERPEMVRHTQGSHDVLLTPADPGGLSLGERALVALRVAELAGDGRLAEHYRGLVRRAGEPAPTPRLALILDHVAMVATAPGTATKAHLDRLRGSGLGARDIVALSQLVAFVSYQVRLAEGLALLAQERSA
jgi:uncharacterized protein YciW